VTTIRISKVYRGRARSGRRCSDGAAWEHAVGITVGPPPHRCGDLADQRVDRGLGGAAAARGCDPAGSPGARGSGGLGAVRSRTGGLSGPPDELVRVQLAKGRLTRTTVPALLSTGPVSFLVQPRTVIIRPLDLVPGYLVPDGRPADRLSGVLSLGGPAIPGPKPGQVWVQTDTGKHAAMTLVGSDGGATGVTIPIPSGSYVTSDGAGYPLFTGPDGAYDAQPDGLHRITTGTVLALGPTRWLTVECDDQDRCENVVIDRGSGKRRILRGPVLHLTPHAGVISPDGSTAAVAGQATLHLLDLKRGTDHWLAVPIDQGAAFDNETVAWSPESRWLFVAGLKGKLLVVDTHTHRVHHLGLALPPITQVAVRRAAH
jgi:hypothetical protein